MRWLKTAMAVFGAAMLLVPAISSAQDGGVKVGVLDDMSGPYSDNTGSVSGSRGAGTNGSSST